MPSASSDTRKLNLAFVAELIAEGATEATLPTALAKIRDRYPVVPGGDKATNKLHSTRRQQVTVQLILALKIKDRYILGALYPEFSSFLPKLMKAKPSAAAEGSNNNSPDPATALRAPPEKYGNPNVNSLTLKKVNVVYGKRLAEIEESSASPETRKRRTNALLQGQKTHFQAPRWVGTKCDKMLGFTQHSGECATDAVQQIVLFADPWKNKIQPLVYNLTDANIADLYATLIASSSGPHPDRAALRSLLRNLQRRFQNHYTTLQLLSHEEECVPQFDYRRLLTEAATELSFAGISLQQKKKLSGELGPSLLRELTTLLPTTLRRTSVDNMPFILKMMFQLFRISYVECTNVDTHIEVKKWFHTTKQGPSPYKGYTHLAFWLYLDPYPPLTPSEPRRGAPGHATAIYSCESIWYYYDNERGIVKLHPHLMEDLLNEVTLQWYIGVGYIASEFIFYKIPYFDAAVDIKALPTKQIHYWDFTTQSWKQCLYRQIVERHSLIFHLRGSIHIMTADHRHTGYTSPYLQDEYVHRSPTERPEPKSASPPKPKSKSASPSMTRKRSSSTERALLKRIADLKNVNNTERALTKRIQNLKNVNNTEKALLARIRSMTRKKSRSAS